MSNVLFRAILIRNIIFLKKMVRNIITLAYSTFLNLLINGESEFSFLGRPFDRRKPWLI
jgi:hypothetical protein